LKFGLPLAAGSAGQPHPGGCCRESMDMLARSAFGRASMALAAIQDVSMAQPPLDPPVADTAPDAETLTSYDEEHLVTYLRLLDAEADGANWTEATRLVLHIDASREPARARRAWESHLARAKWMTEHGYQHLLRGRAPWLTSATEGTRSRVSCRAEARP